MAVRQVWLKFHVLKILTTFLTGNRIPNSSAWSRKRCHSSGACSCCQCTVGPLGKDGRQGNHQLFFSALLTATLQLVILFSTLYSLLRLCFVLNFLHHFHYSHFGNFLQTWWVISLLAHWFNTCCSRSFLLPLFYPVYQWHLH